MNGARYLAVTKGRSLFCLFIDPSGSQGAAMTNHLAEIRRINLQSDVSADTLPLILGYLKV